MQAARDEGDSRMLEALGSNNPPPDRLHVHGSMWSEVFRYVKETLGGGEAED